MSNTRFEVLNMIRDDHDLTVHEKVFLYTVETRNEMWCTYATAHKDMGMSKATYYRTRKSLENKYLISVRKRYNQTTVYIVNADILTQRMVFSHREKYSHTENQVSQRAETKVTIEDNHKVTQKGNQ